MDPSDLASPPRHMCGKDKQKRKSSGLTGAKNEHSQKVQCCCGSHLDCGELNSRLHVLGETGPDFKLCTKGIQLMQELAPAKPGKKWSVGKRQKSHICKITAKILARKKSPKHALTILSEILRELLVCNNGQPLPIVFYECHVGMRCARKSMYMHAYELDMIFKYKGAGFKKGFHEYSAKCDGYKVLSTTNPRLMPVLLDTWKVPGADQHVPLDHDISLTDTSYDTVVFDAGETTNETVSTTLSSIPEYDSVREPPR
jgi:hypothetical protein